MAEGDALVTVERRADGVAVVRIEHGKVNALSGAVLAQLRSAADALTETPPGAVVVTGVGRNFAAGADIREFTRPDGNLISPEEAELLGNRFLTALGALAAVPRATIAAVDGYALGGGCEVALACDFRIASDRAHFGQPEVLLGIIPGGGGTQRLARLVGPARAKDLVLTGRQVDAEEALAIGLVDEVVPADRLLERATERAAELAAGAVVAQGLAKRAIDAGLDTTLGAGLDIEQQLFAEVFGTEDAATGVRSFLDHGPGKARFTGR